MMTDYPQKIESLAVELARLTTIRDDAREALEEVTDEITSAVLRTVEPTTGKPLYTNDKAREIEIRKRQRESEEWQTAANRLERTEHDRSIAAAILERIRGEFSVWKIERREAIAAAEATA